MRLMLSLEERYFRTRNGNVYSNTTFGYNFLRRYLQVFDEVLVLARVCDIDQNEMSKVHANGNGVHFVSAPYYVGPFQYLRQYHNINRVIKKSIDNADAFILRIPGPISIRLWHHLKKMGKPYAVEVVADSKEAMGTVGVNFFLQSFLCMTAPRVQRKQCKGCIAAAYVSKYYLQQKYPPGCWSTYYSSIDLPDEVIIKSDMLEKKIASFKDVTEGKRALRLCHAGTMEVAYKAQDILLEAVSICCAKGMNIRLELLGDGRLAPYYKSKAAQLGIDKYTAFLGMLPVGDAVRGRLDNADIFVFPSTTEGLPRVVIEAMARGLPCIASNVGGIPELLDSEDIIAPGNASILAAKIQEVSISAERMEKMSRRNWRKSHDYKIQVLNKRRIEFYNKVIEETKQRQGSCG